MTRLVVFITSFVFLFVLGVSDAEARRFGGGGSKGTFSRQMVAPKKAPKPVPSEMSRQVAGKTTAATGRGVGGMLMGLAAGGLLAALFMGGAFEGIQIFDIILIGLVLFGVLYFLRSRRSLSEAQPAGTGYSAASNDYQNSTSTNKEGFQATNQVARIADEEQVVFGAPDWFDEKSFLEGARTHFLNLQKAWDANDLSTIEEYVTPQLYKFLQEERAVQVNHIDTKVHKLAVEITNIQQLPSKVVELAIMFHGVINEGDPEDSRFCEIWHLIRDMNEENAPWLIQGIEQVES